MSHGKQTEAKGREISQRIDSLRLLQRKKRAISIVALLTNVNQSIGEAKKGPEVSMAANSWGGICRD